MEKASSARRNGQGDEKRTRRKGYFRKQWGKRVARTRELAVNRIKVHN